MLPSVGFEPTYPGEDASFQSWCVYQFHHDGSLRGEEHNLPSHLLIEAQHWRFHQICEILYLGR